MYTVQVYVLVFESGKPSGEEWVDLATISQRETDAHERAEAESLRAIALDCYRRVRLVKSQPSGLLQHVAGD